MPVRPCTSARAGIDAFLAFFFFLRFLFFVRFFIRCIRANPRSISYPLQQKKSAFSSAAPASIHALFLPHRSY
jgi:hypothetical protein